MIWMDVSDDLRDSSNAKAVRDKLHGATSVSTPLPRATDHPGDLRWPLSDRDGRLDEADSSLIVPDDDVVEPFLCPVGRPSPSLDGIQPLEVSFAGRLPARVQVELKVRENDRHLGGVRDTQGAKCDGFLHEGSSLHNGMLIVV